MTAALKNVTCSNSHLILHILQISENVKHVTAICRLIPRNTDVSHLLLFLCAMSLPSSVAANAFFLSMSFDFKCTPSHLQRRVLTHSNHISCLNPVCLFVFACCVFEYVSHLKPLFNLLPLWVIFGSNLWLALCRLFMTLTHKTH